MRVAWVAVSVCGGVLGLVTQQPKTTRGFVSPLRKNKGDNPPHNWLLGGKRRETRVWSTQGQEPSTSEPTKEQEAFLRARGFVFDESRGVWTKPASGRHPKRRPAIARAPNSPRLAELRFEDSAAEATVVAGRRAADKLKGTLREAEKQHEASPTPRAELEAAGKAVATSKLGPVILALAQVTMVALVRQQLVLDPMPPPAVFASLDGALIGADPHLATAFVVAACACAFAAGSGGPDPIGAPLESELGGNLESAAADAAAGAFAFPAPKAWRKSDLKWRATSACLELAASFPRALAVHCAAQAPLDHGLRALFTLLGDGVFDDPAFAAEAAAVVAALVVSAFAGISEAVAVGAQLGHDGLSNDGARLAAECAAVEHALGDSLFEREPDYLDVKGQPEPEDRVFTALAYAWLDKFLPVLEQAPLQAQGHLISASIAASLRTFAAAIVFRLAADDLAAPVALHVFAAALFLIGPYLPGTTRKGPINDPDRVIMVLR